MIIMKDMVFRSSFALEELTAKDTGNSGIGIDESMLVDLCTDAKIEKNKLKPVTSPIMFNGQSPSPGGLFDPDIFGVDESRKYTYAYIDLHRKFFHPYIFEIICKISGAFKDIAQGDTCGFIDPETKNLVTIKDTEDPNFNPDHTGIPWLVEHFREIKFKETKARTRKDTLRLLADLTDDEIFISKYLVIPVFYRDKEMTNGRPTIPQINNEYKKLIQFCSSIEEDDIFAMYNNALYFRVQSILVGIRQLGQDMISGKHGHYHAAILGKSIDYGSRDVISVPVMNQIQHPRDNPVDMYHTGVPLAKCLVLGYPLIQRYVTNFFEDNFKDKNTVMVYKKGNRTPIEVKKQELKDQLLIYDKKTIDKYMKRFINTYGGRFETIKVYFKDGTVGEFFYTGFIQPTDSANPRANTILNRPMTWTDLFYLAAVETCEDKYIYTTRFPLETYSGTFPSRCRALSTIKTQPAVINGKLYPYYPVIDLSLSTDEISKKFIDTLTMSNLYLAAIGGDYDGDTTSSKMVYSLEANQEAEEIAHSPKNFLSISGGLLRKIKNEAYLTFFNMTRREEFKV